MNKLSNRVDDLLLRISVKEVNTRFKNNQNTRVAIHTHTHTRIIYMCVFNIIVVYCTRETSIFFFTRERKSRPPL